MLLLEDGPFSLPTWRTTQKPNTARCISERERDDHAAVGTSSADLNPVSFDLNFFLPSDRPLRKLTEQHQSSRKRLPSTCIYCLPPNSYLKAQTLNQSFFNHQKAFIKQRLRFVHFCLFISHKRKKVIWLTNIYKIVKNHEERKKNKKHENKQQTDNTGCE